MRQNWLSLSSAVLAAFVVIGLTSGAHAQTRLSDKDLEALMRNLRDDAKSFRSPFESDLKKSTIRKTSREKDARQLAERFEKDTEAMLNHFKSTKKADADLSTVRSTAQQLDSIVAQLNLGPQTTSRWNKIQTELRQISDAFGIRQPISRYDNPRGITPYGGSEGQSCGSAVGMERAKTLVNECLAVSPATHPPCNAENSCRMITDEIKRGCAMLKNGAPSFCNEYR
jgi:regulator of sigma D